MKTSEISRAGLLCAVYGVLIVFNTMTGLMAESVFPWLFALPVLLAGLSTGWKTSSAALGAMLLITLMLGSMTTWLNAGSMLICGWLFGAGAKKGWHLLSVSAISFLIETVIGWISMTLLASLFGFTGEEEQQLYQWIAPWLSWQGFLLILAAFTAFIQVFVMACFTIVIVFKSQGKIPVSLRWSFQIRPWCAFSEILLLILEAAVFSNMLLLPVGLKDLVLILLLFNTAVLIWQGAVTLIRSPWALEKPQRTALIEVCAFIPGISLIHAAIGWADLAKKGWQNMRNRR